MNNDPQTTAQVTPLPDDIKELIAWANKQPVVMSLLYDLDLMPEQVDERSREQGQMLLVIAHFKASMAEADQQLQAARAREAELAKALKALVAAERDSRDQFTAKEIDAIEAALKQADAALQSPGLTEQPQGN